jgi:polysaccharide deacetylase family protein (PEP-CTERM system associated)
MPALPTADAGPTPMVNVFTIDVEDYYHVSAFAGVAPPERWPSFESRVEASTSRILDLCAAADVRGTFFVLGWVADRWPAMVRRIADNGHELASHSYWHRLVYDMTPETFRDDLRRARTAIEQAAGVRVRGFRAPSYSITARSLWALDVLQDEGYEYDASIFPIRHDVYGIPDAPRHAHRRGTILEVPGTTALVGGTRIPVGGGYFRLFPYSVTRWAVSRVNRMEGKPAIFYLHPWEIDPEQPRLAAPWRSTLRHYNSLGRTELRLRRLLSDFRWDTVARVMLDGSRTRDGVPTGRVDPAGDSPLITPPSGGDWKGTDSTWRT